LAPRAHSKALAAELPDAELEVLACLHELGEVEVAEIRRALARFRPLSHASVSTLLRRLEGRGLVSRRKGPVGKSLLWAALPSAQATYRGLLTRLLDRVFAGDPVRLVSSLVSSRRLSGDELRRLRSIVDELEAKR
jgi:predicted transcriptional regulator